MPFYLFQLSYSADAIKAMVARPTDREAAARNIAEAAGGKLHHLFFCFGRHDVVCLFEAPDDKVMAAVAMVVGGSGAAGNVMTTKLMTSAEAMDAMAIAGKATGAYVPPMG